MPLINGLPFLCATSSPQCLMPKTIERFTKELKTTLQSVSCFILFPSVFFLFLIACNDHGPTQIPRVSDLEKDSVRIVQYIDSALKTPNRADSFLQQSQRLIADRPELEDIYNLSYGRYLILSGELDQARNHVQQVIDGFGTDTLNYGLAKYHNLLAAVAGYSKEQEKSVSQFQQAIKIYELHHDQRQAAIIKFNLANIFFARLDYHSAYKYSSEALEPLVASRDTAMLTLCLAISSIATANLNEIDVSERYALEALELAEQHPNLQGKLFANYAMGEVELAKTEYPKAIARLTQTIAHGEEHSMLQWLVPIRASLLRAYVDAEDFPSAIPAGEKLVEQATVFNNRDVLYSAYKHLAHALEKQGQHQRAYAYLKDADELFKEHMSEANERAIHDMLVKYEVERKRNIILTQENDLARQRMWGTIILTGALAVIFGLLWVWKNSRQKNKLLTKERENAVFQALNTGEEQERKRLSAELHDGIASNLVAIKLQLEQEVLSAENNRVLALVSQTHREVRKVAHNLSPMDFSSITLSQAIRSFAQECSSENCFVSFQTNITGQIEHFDKDTALIIYRSVQELMQNALKHANASAINVQLMQKDSATYMVSIEDNGKGFDSEAELSQKGGLHNLFARLEKIRADVNLESHPGAGTSVFIIFKAH